MLVIYVQLYGNKTMGSVGYYIFSILSDTTMPSVNIFTEKIKSSSFVCLTFKMTRN